MSRTHRREDHDPVVSPRCFPGNSSPFPTRDAASTPHYAPRATRATRTRRFPKKSMPSVASFMMPASKCVTAVPEDKLSSVVTSLVHENIGCVVVVDASTEKAVGIVTKQDVCRMYLDQVSGVSGRLHKTPRQNDRFRASGSTRTGSPGERDTRPPPELLRR